MQTRRPVWDMAFVEDGRFVCWEEAERGGIEGRKAI